MKVITDPAKQKAFLEKTIHAHLDRLKEAGIDMKNLELVIEGPLAELFGLPSGVKPVWGEKSKVLGKVAGVKVFCTPPNPGQPYYFSGDFVPQCCKKGHSSLRTMDGKDWSHDFFRRDDGYPIRYCMFCGTKLPTRFPRLDGSENLYKKLDLWEE